MKIHFSSSREKTVSHFSSRISRDRDSCQGLQSLPIQNLPIMLLPVLSNHTNLPIGNPGRRILPFRLCYRWAGSDEVGRFGLYGLFKPIKTTNV